MLQEDGELKDENVRSELHVAVSTERLNKKISF